MASLLQKLLTKQPVNSIVDSFNNKAQSPNLILPLSTHLHQEPHLSGVKPHHLHNVSPSPLLGPPKAGVSIPSHSGTIFPSFPFGFSLNPVPSVGLGLSNVEDVVSGGSLMIWADSVKKKRKKKMNKHKYNKLRKRLRNQS